MRMSIRNRITIAFVTIIIFMIVDMVIFSRRVQKLETASNRLVNVYLPSLSFFNEYRTAILSSEMLLKNWVFVEKETDTPDKRHLEILVNNLIPALQDSLLVISEKWNDTLRNNLKEVVAKTGHLLDLERAIMGRLNTPEAYQDSLTFSEVQGQLSREGIIDTLSSAILQDLQRLHARISRLQDRGKVAVQSVLEKNQKILLSIHAFFIILLIFLSYFILKSITDPINYLKHIISEMAYGKLPKDKLKEKNDEIGDMTKALNRFIDNLRKTASFAVSIGKKDFDKVDFQPLSDGDVLGKALVKMRDDLKKAEEEEMERREEDAHRKWISEGLAKFSEILRENNDNLEVLSDEVLKNLVHYTGANIGALYLLQEDGEDEEHGVLEMIAAYAYDRKKYLHKTIYVGEGLVGACAIEKEKIYMTDIPDDYIKVRSGLGESKPRSLLLVPLKINEEIFGVLELASIEELPDYKVEFVEKLAESLAVTLNSVKINIRTKELLEQSRQQAEELATQEEEMRQNLEELLATQEELARQKAEMESVFTAIKSSNLYAELTISGKVLNMSKIYKDLLGVDNTKATYLTLSELVGSDEEAENVMAELKRGNIVKKEVNIWAGGKTIWLSHTFSPILDANGTIEKILDIASDFTTIKEAEIKLREQQEALEIQEDEMRTMILELQKEVEEKEVEFEAREKELKQEIEDLKDKLKKC